MALIAIRLSEEGSSVAKHVRATVGAAVAWTWSVHESLLEVGAATVAGDAGLDKYVGCCV